MKIGEEPEGRTALKHSERTITMNIIEKILKDRSARSKEAAESTTLAEAPMDPWASEN